MEDPVQVYIVPQIVNLLSGFACAVSFLFLISLDLVRAWKRRAYWLPGEALVLSALTIQLLTLLDDSNISVSGTNDNKRRQEVAVLLDNQLLIDSGRLLLCVFIGYLLPGMARSSSATEWGDIGALAISLSVHMCSELYFVRRKSVQKLANQRGSFDFKDYAFFWQETKGSNRIWFIITSATILAGIIFLLLLLGCAAFAGKSIRDICRQKIYSALGENSNSQRGVKKIDEQQVLKSWIVAYACQPDYIISRSVLSASAGVVVTVCVLLSVFKWIFVNHIHLNPHRYYAWNKVKNTVLVIQFLFVLVGWSVICWRWITAVVYFPRRVQSKQSMVMTFFYVEDFWTRHVKMLHQHMGAEIRGRLFRRKRILQRNQLQVLRVNLVTKVKLHSLLHLLVCLQLVLVSISQAFWFFSEIVFGNKFVRRIILCRHKKMLLDSWNHSSEGNWKPISFGRRSEDSYYENFYKYIEVLKRIRMPAESAVSLWIANEEAIKKTEDHMNQAYGEGVHSFPELRALMTKTSPELNIGRSFLEKYEADKKLLKEEEYFKYLGTFSWKMTAVSLIQIMLAHSDQTSQETERKAIHAYSQAWEFMDFVDTSLGPEADLASRAADKRFDHLHCLWMISEQSPPPKLDKLPEEETDVHELNYGKSCKADTANALHDSKDWKKAATNVGLYKTYKAWRIIKSQHTEHMDRIKFTWSLLADIITICMEDKLPGALKKFCTEWAADFKEEEIFKAVSIAGKAKGVLEGPHEVEETENPLQSSLLAESATTEHGEDIRR